MLVGKNKNNYSQHLQESQTTCEIYYELVKANMLPSVSSALYSLLHFGARADLQSKFYLPKQSLKYFYNWSNFGTRKGKLTSDIVFLYHSLNLNYLGIQTQISKICSAKGISTEIICRNKEFNQLKHIFDTASEMKKPYPLISNKQRKQIQEQCQFLSFELKHRLGLEKDIADEDLTINLFRLAAYIESLSNVLLRNFERNKAKVLVLLNSNSDIDIAARLASKRLGLKTILIPHGFPQRSQYPITSDDVISFCPHHDNYLQTLSSNQTSVHGLGWLEPSISLESNFGSKKIPLDNIISAEKYKVLVLSQLTGYKIHRCQSLVFLFPRLLRELASIPEVESVCVRFHPNESNDLIVRTLLSEIHGSKVCISDNKSIVQDLMSCNAIVSFSSTGLLYGPYLGINAIEIRNQQIDSVWGKSVLPDESVLHITEDKDWNGLRDLVVRKDFPIGRNVFHNWGNETEAFSQFIGETLQSI